ncbi:MAG: hypothetical protein ABJA49_18455 [Betaproteobacteria bacterium]
MRSGTWGRAFALRRVVPIMALAFWVGANAAQDPAQLLLEQHASLNQELQQSAFGRPLVLRSRQAGDHVSGEVFAVVDHPLDDLRAQLSTAQQWCEVLLLHFNTKSCRATPLTGGTSVLAAFFGKKTEQELADAARVDFTFETVAASANYLHVSMHAGNGPMATSNYRIALQAVGLDANRTFLRFLYAYDVGFAGQMAMKVYLATAGRDKVGFSADPARGGQSDRLVDGLRGVVERNAMRYYLAIDVTLDTADVAPRERQRDARLSDWFSATERYKRQLHELDRDDYLAIKRAEFRRALTQR